MTIKSGNHFALVIPAIAIASISLAVSFWVVPHSILGWLALLIAGIPAWLFLEWLGEAVLSRPCFQRLPSAARILVGLPVVIALMVLALSVAMFVKNIVTEL